MLMLKFWKKILKIILNFLMKRTISISYEMQYANIANYGAFLKIDAKSATLFISFSIVQRILLPFNEQQIYLLESRKGDVQQIDCPQQLWRHF